MLNIDSMESINKFTYKVTLSYKGTHYFGWQYQVEHSETIENIVGQVIANISKHQEYKVIGASRTDAGVHASGQVVKIVLPREISPDILTMGMNSKLPSDIRVVKSEFIHESFNPNRDSKYKEYHYYFTIKENDNAAFFDSVYSYPEDLDLNKMNEACNALVGELNFRNYCSPGPRPGNLHRSILKCSIEKTHHLAHDTEIFFLNIQGTGFLRYMVRYLMGAIWDIGVGKLSIDDFILSLKDGDKYGVRTKAPARGLHLMNIEY